MKNLIILLAVILLSSCVNTEEKYTQMVSDTSFGILLVKGDNDKAVLPATIEIKEVDTGHKVHLNDMIQQGNRGNPVVFKLKPGVYRLSRYLLYNNVKPRLDHINYYFSIEPGKVNYVGDWSFKEHWSNGKLDVDFFLNYNPETVNAAKQVFNSIFNRWELKSR